MLLESFGGLVNPCNLEQKLQGYHVFVARERVVFLCFLLLVCFWGDFLFSPCVLVWCFGVFLAV